MANELAIPNCRAKWVASPAPETDELATLVSPARPPSPFGHLPTRHRHRSGRGQIEVAYPFSRQPTGHTVHLTGHPPVAAMCAIDALGIPLMTGTDGVIDSADPDTGTAIRIHRHSDEWTWQPATAVVVIAQSDCSGTLADTLCGSITFHTDQQLAHSHLDNHPELHGHIIGQADAISLADCAFRGLLATSPAAGL